MLVTKGQLHLPERFGLKTDNVSFFFFSSAFLLVIILLHPPLLALLPSLPSSHFGPGGRKAEHWVSHLLRLDLAVIASPWAFGPLWKIHSLPASCLRSQEPT